MMNRQQYLDLITPAMEITVKKHQDYANDLVGLDSYFPFGMISHVQMIHVKSQRLVGLTRSGREANYESVKDSLYDLINYAVFALEHLDKDPNK